MLFKSKSTLPTKLVYFLLLVTFKIKDFIGHYLKLMVLQGYTWFGLMDIVYFDENHVIEVQEHIINSLIIMTFKIKDFRGH